MAKKYTLEELQKTHDVVSGRSRKNKQKKLNMKELPSDYEVVSDDAEPTEEPSILGDVGYIAEGFDRITGAPTRKAIGEFQESGSPVEAIKAGFQQFGEPVSEAPTGEELLPESIEDPMARKILGTGVEFVADPSAIAGAGMKGVSKAMSMVRPIRVSLRGKASRNLMKSMAQISTNSKVKEALKKMEPEEIGDALIRADLEKYSNRPKTLVDKILGKKKVKYEKQRVGKKTIDKPVTTYEKGLLSQNADEVDNLITQLDDQVDVVDVAELQQEMLRKNIRLRMDTTSAEKFSPKEIQKYEETIEQYLKTIGDGPNERSISELQKLKREIGKKLASKDFFAPTDRKIAFEKAALKDVYYTLKRKIEDVSDGVIIDGGKLGKGDAGTILKMLNDKSAKLIELTSMLDYIPAKELRDPSKAQNLLNLIITGTAGVTAYGVTQSPYYGVAAAVGAGAGLAKKGVESKLPAWLGRKQAQLSKGRIPLDPTMKGVLGASAGAGAMSRMPRLMNQGREPQSVAEQIETTPLSRNTQELMSQPQLFLGKIAQQKPQAFDLAKEAMRQGGMYLDNFIKQMVIESPHLFEQDKYNRIDGKITDPASRATAIKDVNNMGDLNPVEKAEIIDKLNKTGEFPL